MCDLIAHSPVISLSVWWLHWCVVMYCLLCNWDSSTPLVLSLCLPLSPSFSLCLSVSLCVPLSRTERITEFLLQHVVPGKHAYVPRKTNKPMRSLGSSRPMRSLRSSRTCPIVMFRTIHLIWYITSLGSEKNKETQEVLRKTQEVLSYQNSTIFKEIMEFCDKETLTMVKIVFKN